MEQSTLKDAEITSEIIGRAMQVHSTLENGFQSNELFRGVQFGSWTANQFWRTKSEI